MRDYSCLIASPFFLPGDGCADSGSDDRGQIRCSPTMFLLVEEDQDYGLSESIPAVLRVKNP